jgi:SWI/SNF-related matrix-associated actin-dependent regulator of chromatin subfamily A3
VAAFSPTVRVSCVVKVQSLYEFSTHPSLSLFVFVDMGLGKTIQSIALILANPPKSKSPKCTLIVCPLSVISNWENQINDHVDKKLKVTVWAGSDREKHLVDLYRNKTDVLIVSYGTLGSDFNNFKKAEKEEGDRDSIFDIAFHRVILDEAHNIRNSSTGYFKSVKALKTERKLCLTGTPFNNHPNDIQSLLAFLNVEPLCEKKVFDYAVTDEIMQKKELGLVRLRTIMAHVALRRTKEEVKVNLGLVDKLVEVRVVDFPEGIHKKTHDSLFAFARSLFVELVKEAADSEKGGIQHATTVFTMVLRVRQACCHAGLVDQALLRRIEEIAAGIEDGRFEEEDVSHLVSMLFGKDKLDVSIDDAELAGDMTSGPKVDALLEGIKEMKKGEKAVIFSQVSWH